MDDLKKNEDIEMIIRNAPLCILQFGSASCAPCGAIRRRIDDWLKEQDTGIAYYIDIEKYPAFSAQKGILSVPAVQIYMDGKLMNEKAGYFSLDRMLDDTERLLKLNT